MESVRKVTPLFSMTALAVPMKVISRALLKLAAPFLSWPDSRRKQGLSKVPVEIE